LNKVILINLTDELPPQPALLRFISLATRLDRSAKKEGFAWRGVRAELCSQLLTKGRICGDRTKLDRTATSATTVIEDMMILDPAARWGAGGNGPSHIRDATARQVGGMVKAGRIRRQGCESMIFISDQYIIHYETHENACAQLLAVRSVQ
jgi:hypothetical protein